MQDKTIKQIAQSKRIQDAFFDEYSATEEEKAKPMVFVVSKIIGIVRAIVERYEEKMAAAEAVKKYQETKVDISL